LQKQRLICHPTFFKKKFLALPEPVQFEIGAFLEEVTWNPYKPELVRLPRTRQNSKGQFETLLLPSGWRILWTIEYELDTEEYIRVFDVLEPQTA
jgi:hypothetical protein